MSNIYDFKTQSSTALFIIWNAISIEICLQSFTYIFPCDFARKSNEVDIYGTGGSILADMKGLLLNLTGLKRLELLDLELEEMDGNPNPNLT